MLSRSSGSYEWLLANGSAAIDARLKSGRLGRMVKPTPNLDDLYVVLRSHAVAKPGQLCTYTELSHQYKTRTGDWFEPHGSWDAPLGALNQRLHAAAAPALSAVVVLKGDPPEPGRGFWGSAPSVPPRPKSEMERLTTWQAVLQAVFVHPWPAALP
jgi:hypothetical protein